MFVDEEAVRDARYLLPVRLHGIARHDGFEQDAHVVHLCVPQINPRYFFWGIN